MSDIERTLEALERQQMLDREQLVVRNLHERGLCLTECPFCAAEKNKVKLAPLLTDQDHEYAHEKGICVDSCPHCAANRQANRLDTTLKQRGKQYGPYPEMAAVAQGLKMMMEEGPSYRNLTAVQRESLDIIATKIARIVSGEPNQRDSWHDIAGYATLAEEMLTAQVDETS
jgi:hypothetical protein